jgi:cytochrome c556
MRKLLRPLLLVAGISLAAPAFAQFAKPESAVKYRQSAMAVMGNHAGRLGAVAQGKVPYNRDAVVRSAEIIQFMSLLPYEAFTPGSDMVATTKAKPEIWTNEAEFKKLATDMQDKVDKLVVAAKAGTLEALRPAFKAAVDACNACHDKYQEK